MAGMFLSSGRNLLWDGDSNPPNKGTADPGKQWKFGMALHKDGPLTFNPLPFLRERKFYWTDTARQPFTPHALRAHTSVCCARTSSRVLRKDRILTRADTARCVLREGMPLRLRFTTARWWVGSGFGEMMGLDQEEVLFMPPTHPTIETASSR